MTTVVKEIYEAFIEAGVSKETANRVADSLGESIERLIRKDDEHVATKRDVDRISREMTDLKSSLIMWMAGFHVASVGIVVTLLLNAV